MTERAEFEANHFVPERVLQPAAINKMVAENPDQQAQLALAQEVMGKTDFNGLMQRTSEYETFVRTMSRVETKAQFDTCSTMFAAVKSDYQVAEEMRKQAVAFPDKFVRMVNKLFKETIKDPLELLKKKLGRERDEYIHRAEEEAEKVRQEIEEAARVTSEGMEGVMAGVVSLEAGPVLEMPAVDTVSRTEIGTVYQRESTTVEVKDMMALLKCIVSRDKRWAWVTEELIEVKIGPLKAALAANGWKKLPGVEVIREKRSV